MYCCREQHHLSESSLVFRYMIQNVKQKVEFLDIAVTRCFALLIDKLTLFTQGALVPRGAFTLETVDTVLADAILARVAGTLVDIYQKYHIKDRQ